MKNIILLVLLCVVIFTSCNKQDSFTASSEKTEITILQERDPNSPLILLNKSVTRGVTRGIGHSITFDNCLGRTFKCAKYPLGSIEDVGFAVIDVGKFHEDFPSYFAKRRIGEGVSSTFCMLIFRLIRLTQV